MQDCYPVPDYPGSGGLVEKLLDSEGESAQTNLDEIKLKLDEFNFIEEAPEAAGSPEAEIFAVGYCAPHHHGDGSLTRRASWVIRTIGDRDNAVLIGPALAEKLGIKVKYMHSDIDTIERNQIIRGLRHGEFDVLIGINLLREGLDLPEVSLVAILDADKEGFLRSETALIQTMGRAARNANGRVIMFAKKITRSMQAALDTVKYRRERQMAYNKEHGITPTTVIRKMDENLRVEEYGDIYDKKSKQKIPKSEKQKIIKELKRKMLDAAKALEFEAAAKYRDEMEKIKKL